MGKRPASKGSKVESEIVSLKISLRGAKPPIWRRLLVSRDMTLSELHLAIQAVMGWDDSHLHGFKVADRNYGPPDEYSDEFGIGDEDGVTVGEAIKARGARFTYIYDFGDSWVHIIEADKKRPVIEAGRGYPACVAGERACPPEDCGGIWGYEELLALLADPANPERPEWLGEEFDPEKFSVKDADDSLAGLRLRA